MNPTEKSGLRSPFLPITSVVPGGEFGGMFSNSNVGQTPGMTDHSSAHNLGGGSVLRVETDTVLSQDNGWVIPFSAGILSPGLEVSADGSVMTVRYAGRYRLELVGMVTTTILSEIRIEYRSNFADAVQDFSQIVLPPLRHQLLYGCATILPFRSGQSLSVALVSATEEPITVKAGSRLLLENSGSFY